MDIGNNLNFGIPASELHQSLTREQWLGLFAKNTLLPNPVLETDSYKLSHPSAYPKKVKGMFAYIEARSKGDTIVPFGLQMWIKKFLTLPACTFHIDEAEAFAKLHGEPFSRTAWEYIIAKHGGYFPVKIRTVPEGTRVPSGNALVTVEALDPDFTEIHLHWLATYLETTMQRGVWYPTTIASNDYKNWRAIKRYQSESCETLALLPFSLHDFGGRGVSSGETAQIGGAAHCVFFQGSDTIEGVRAANFYYRCMMAAFSVPATEHSIQCSYGPIAQRLYLESILNLYAKPGAIVSIVLDGYDVYRESQTLCEMKDKIVASGARVVFRPDSGDPLEVIPRILKMQAAAFGYTMVKGYKVINSVGILQGDGIDYDSMCQILDKVTELGFSASNIVFGSGGGLLQKVNRDTYKFAMKASAILEGDKWVDIFKDPITDPGKTSKKGRLTLYKSNLSGEFMTGRINDNHDAEWEDVMVTVYDGVNNPGELLIEYTLDEIRARAQG